MDLSGSGSGSNKRKHVADDGGAKIREQQDKFKAVIGMVKTTMKETEKAYLLEIAYCEKKAERDLLGRMKKSDFNIDEEIRLVDEELKLADVEKQGMKVTTIDWDKLGFGSAYGTSASFIDD